MKHHRGLEGFTFYKEPLDFNKNTDRDFLQYCLGATLYMKGTRNIADKILNKSLPSITSIVLDFEDAIPDKDLNNAENSVFSQLSKLSEAISNDKFSIDDLPLIFLRPRCPLHLADLLHALNEDTAKVLTGFCLPKISTYNCRQYLDLISFLRQKYGSKLYCMPILEGKLIAHRESRIKELEQLKQIFGKYRETILNVRVGGTDFSSVFGVRRGINYSIYDLLPVRDCLSDILNYFIREEDNYVISGPVWEYFLASKDDSLNTSSDKSIHRTLLAKNPVLNECVDGLLREVLMDKINGFVGKTIIHPTHARHVNGMQSELREEYEDAIQILETDGGVVKSHSKNKMNEINPHKYWAKCIIQRAKAFGVIENEFEYLKLFAS